MLYNTLQRYNTTTIKLTQDTEPSRGLSPLQVTNVARITTDIRFKLQ